MPAEKHYNLAVIGGGPSGMMAAGTAGTLGASVILLEKNPLLGIKLMVTGKGRCNITNVEDETRKLVEKYGPQGKFLFSALNKFSTKDTVDFFENLGVATKVERGGRIFPKSDMAKSVLDALKKYLENGNVEVLCNSPVKKIIANKGKIEKIILANNKEIFADKYLIATGGKSYPKTGSTGDGYKFLKELGHTIIEPRAALTPIIIKESFIKALQGLSLKNVEVSIWKDKKIAAKFGEALFTDNGLSGPVILDLSKIIGENLKNEIGLKIDFKPALSEDVLDKRIQRDFAQAGKKIFKNALNQLLPLKLIPIIIKLSKIPENKKVSEITKTERMALLKLLKEFPLTVIGLVGYEKAIVTAGGVNLKEVNPNDCSSKIISNLYLVGEVLDIDGPTGGYNLQVCWSTGHLAGESAAKN